MPINGRQSLDKIVVKTLILSRQADIQILFEAGSKAYLLEKKREKSQSGYNIG
jgi:hypothetical protein